jgi:hypothetical protein
MSKWCRRYERERDDDGDGPEPVSQQQAGAIGEILTPGFQAREAPDVMASLAKRADVPERDAGGPVASSSRTPRAIASCALSST